VSYSYLTSELVLAVGFIISGFCVLKGKPWSRYLILITTGLDLGGLVKRFILLGPFTEEYFYLISFATAALFIWFFNREPTRVRFPYRKGLTVLTIVWIASLSIAIFGAGFMWFKYGGYTIPKLQKGVYKSHNESFYSQDYFRSPFPLKYTLAIPHSFTLYHLHRDDSSGVTVSLMSPQKDFLMMGDRTVIQDLPSFKILGYNDPYQLTQKYFSERYGLIFTIMKVIAFSTGVYRVEEAQINGLRGFVQKGSGKTWISEYYLFQEHKPIGGGFIVGRKEEGGLSQQRIDEIISSIKPQDEVLKSAQEFFREGMILFDRHDFERAKLSFASALCLSWKNSQYHYYLGRAFYETKNWNSAKKHLEQALSLQPDYPEAQKFLTAVEKNVKK